MKPLSSILRAAMVGAAIFGVLATPASALPLQTNGAFALAGTTVQQVDYRHHWKVYRRNGHYYAHGHRIYRYHHRGYRYHDGWWVPPALFGLAIGGMIMTAPRYDHGSAHVRWCYRHYRSYRAYDDTYQPYHGPRRRCISPY